MPTAEVREKLGTVVTLIIMLVVADNVFCHKGKTVWRNPCGFRLKTLARKRYLLVDKEISPDGLRHPSSRPLRNVRSEFRTTYEQFGSEPVQREITQVYSGVKNVLKEEFKYYWLPSNQLDWYRSSVKCLDKKSKVKVLLPTLHVSLQNFSATFENLLMSSGQSYLSEHQELFSTRRHLLTEIYHQVNRLLCEVETAIINLGLEQPSSLTVEAAEDMLWDTRPDHTHGLMQDWVVLAAYRSFLNDWMLIVRRLVGRKSNEPCRTRHKRPRPRT